MMLTIRALVAIAAASALLSCAHGGSTASGGLEQSNSQTIVIADKIEPRSLNPLDTSANVRSAVFDCLVRRGANGQFVPDLALTYPTIANGGISKDGLSFTYHLRRNVTWQDGKPFTARDVIFTIKAIVDPRNREPIQLPYSLVKSASASDPYTLNIVLKGLYPPFAAQFFAAWCVPILPEHLLAKYADLVDVPFNEAPIGTGPYRVERWDRGNSLTLIRYDGYFGGRPAIKRIVDRFVANDTTVSTMLRTGEIDANLTSNPVQAHELASDPSLDVYRTPSMQTADIVFNCDDTIMKSRLMRLAIAHAIDAQRLASEISNGAFRGYSADKVIFGPAYDPSIVGARYDPALAAQMLDRAGWKLGPDGVRYSRQKKLELTLIAVQSAVADSVAVLLQQQLGRSGIQLDIKTYVPSVLFAIPSGPLHSGRFQMFFGPGFYWDGMDSDLSRLTACSARMPRGENSARYCDPQVDAAYAAALREVNPTSRARFYREAQQLLTQDPPWLGLWNTLDFQVVNKRIQHFAPTTAFDPYAGVDKWRL